MRVETDASTKDYGDYLANRDAVYVVTSAACAVVAVVFALVAVRRWHRREAFHRGVEQSA